MNMSKVILFDLGNVLARPLNNYELYENLKCKISYQEFENYWFCDEVVIDAHKGLVSDEYHIKKLLEFCKSDLSIKDFYTIYNELDNSLYIDTVNIIKKLKDDGYKVGILSNLRLMDYNRYKDAINLLNLDYEFLSYEMGFIKPYDEIYQMVIQKCNCDSKDIVFFDDNKKNVDGAKRCGINAYLATGENIKEIFYKINLNNF